MALVTGLTLVSQISNLLFFKLWGKLADRFSNKSVLSVSARLFLGCLLGWTFIPYHASIQSTLPLTAILHILQGISYAGVLLAGGNMALKLAPQEKSVSFLAVNNFTSSIAAGVAPVLGGLFADYFSHAELSLALQWQNINSVFNVKTLDFQYWDFFFVLAFLLGLMSLGRLTHIRELGDVRKRIIVRAFLEESGRSLPRWRMPKQQIKNQAQKRVNQN
jgi:MFS family permease